MQGRILCWLVAAGAVGCATVPPAGVPKSARIEAYAGLDNAQKVVQAAAPLPKAATQIDRARQDVKMGDALMQQGQFDVARLYYERAAAETDVAIALANAKQAEKVADDSEARLKSSRPEGAQREERYHAPEAE